MGLVLAASQSNGLVGANLQPWHLKASYKLLDSKGKTTDEGTIEEYWASHHKRRVTYTGSNFSTTTYWTESGIFNSGTGDLPFHLIGDLRSALVEPMPPEEFLKTQVFEIKKQDSHRDSMTCATAKITPASKADFFKRVLGPTYCFNMDKPVLRVNDDGMGMRPALLNRVIEFQGRFVAQDVQILQQDNPVATLHLDSLEGIQTTDDAEFSPPTDARLVPKPISALNGIARGVLLTLGVPHRPSTGEASHTFGTVVIAALIGKDGKITNLHVESGPPLLQPAVLDAVKQYVYWPFFDDGEPVEVTTWIETSFSFH